MWNSYLGSASAYWWFLTLYHRWAEWKWYSSLFLLPGNTAMWTLRVLRKSAVVPQQTGRVIQLVKCLETFGRQFMEIVDHQLAT
jgi:hypothetical protein